MAESDSHPSVPPSELPASTFAGGLADLVRSHALAPPTRPGIAATLDRFEIVRVLGVGGMGLVLLARDPHTSGLVALKLIKPELRDQPHAVHRFLVEVRHMQRLDHSHVLKVREVCERADGPYFVMPYLERGSLARLLKPGEPLEAPVIVRLASQVAAALHHAHRKGIIHRDLKPANVLLDEQGNAFLGDFGLARTLFNDSLVDAAREEQCEGTAPYMSPAVAAGQVEDTRCDIYSFGAMLYEMLTGRLPYEGRSAQQLRLRILAGPPRPVRELNPKAPADLTRICEGAMARELRDRYATMADVLADLERIERGRPVLGPRHSGHPAAIFRRIVHTGRPVAMAAGLVVLGVAGWRGIGVLHRPAPQGRLLLWGERTGGNSYHIWLADLPDGTVTQLPNAAPENRDPRWVPSAAGPPSVVYASGTNGHCKLWKAQADGQGRQPLTTGPAKESNPCPSPDGRWIAYARYAAAGTEIRVTGTDGTGDRLVKGLCAGVSCALHGWLPDGSRLLLGLNPPGDVCHSKVYSIQLDGSGQTNFLNPFLVSQDAVDLFTLSADGRKAAWVAELGCAAWTREVYTADILDGQVDTNSIVRVTKDQVEDTAPALSPDGRLVAYASSYNPVGYDPPFHVFIQRSDGRGPRATILKDFFRAYPAAWAP